MKTYSKIIPIFALITNVCRGLILKGRGGRRRVDEE
jgi:hypothetical protein